MDEDFAIAHEIIVQLGVQKSNKILDFGCGDGTLVKCLRTFHYDAYGVDSENAINSASEDVKPYLAVLRSNALLESTSRSLVENLPERGFDWIYANDVLEYISYKDLPKILKTINRITERFFAITALGDNEKGKKRFVVTDAIKKRSYSRKVRKICENFTWWRYAFEDAGFYVKEYFTYLPYVKESERGGYGFFNMIRFP